MSWGISFIGKSERVVEALKAQSEKLAGHSKEEYDAALPHMIALVEQNFGLANNELIQINANGHGHFQDNVTQNRKCNVQITSLYGVLV